MEDKSQLGGLFYPTKDRHGNEIPFDSLFIPYIYREIYFEGLYVDVLNGRKDMTILDIGANIGVTVQHFRNFAKKVYAVEPSTEHFNALKKNKEFNKWDNVEIFKAAIADRDGEMTLRLFDQNRTCHSLVFGEQPGRSDAETVKTYAFDTFFKENNIDEVDFCKFDVEGAEDLILRSPGFEKIASKIKAIEIEFHFPTYPELVKHLIKLGFNARRYPSSAVVILFTR
jgi:FkbM family methyltransferase